ncbi:MAG: 6,7-dimethyl-8-ribityllumazine synthase [Candidatus Daviesbacteria bacterium]|nr:6,7-dimethyl-8-ribityllumazine synthase [Candidatus Daviesbacteria bacterium]
MIKDLSKNPIKYSKNNQNLKIAIVRANYHQDLTKSLEDACRNQLIKSGVKMSNITTFEVPGSWEIPLVTKRLAAKNIYDGIATFGIIIKGETYHFEVLANQSAKALMKIALEFDIPIIFEILTTYNLAQAKKRSAGKYNKGIEAAKSLLETINTLTKL